MTEIQNLGLGLEQYLLKGSETPSTPFLYGPALKMVTSELESLGFSKTGEGLPQSVPKVYASDEHALYARIRRGAPTQKLIVTTHLDHPFIVLDGKGGGAPLGSIGNSRLKNLAESTGIPLRVYSKEGVYEGTDTIVGVKADLNRPEVKTKMQTSYEANSHGIWDIEPVQIESGLVKMINSDNAASTAVMLSVLNALSQDEQVQNIDAEFVFNYLEEIKQVSAVGTALKGRTPFGEIGRNSVIVVLESASAETPAEYEGILNSMHMPKANYSDGPIIRVNDRDVIYGQKFGGGNLAEDLLLNVADEMETKFQHTLVGGTCDATPYTLFLNTPNIAGITMPTRFKHNTGPQGEIVREEVRIEDLNKTQSILLRSIEALSQKALMSPNPNSISSGLKKTEAAATSFQLKNLARERIATYKTSIQRLRRGVFYPEKLSDSVKFFYGRVDGRLHR